MSAVIKLPYANALTAQADRSSWDMLPSAQREAALKVEQLLAPVLAQISRGISQRAAVENLLARLEADAVDAATKALALEVNKGKLPSAATLNRWVKRYREEGLAGLAPKYKGSERKAYGWEVRAMHLWQQPTKPDMATVALWLQDEGWASATYSRVRRYLNSLPETLGAQSAARMGKHYYNQNLRSYVRRDQTVLPIGFIYEGDGHTCDTYIAHPNTGRPWRPELTVWIDVRSHYLVAFYLSEAESARSTLFALSRAIVAHDHMPAAIHVDPGSGFKNRLMTDDVTGYCARFSVEFMGALPGNAKGKGLVERWFGIFEERCGKQFATYCGHDRTDDYLRHLTAKVKRGVIQLPTLAQYRDAVAAFIERYNNTPQDSLGGQTPAQLWAQLERVPLGSAEGAIVRPQTTATVRRWSVRLHNREYQHPDLAHVNGRRVAVEYDLHDDRLVTVRDLQGRFICDAELIDRKPWLPVSRIEELQQQRLRGQAKRLRDKLEEAEARAGLAITHEQVLEDVEALAATRLLEGETGPGAATPDPASDDQAEGPALDIFSTDY